MKTAHFGEFAGQPSLTINHSKHTPHWKIYEDGRASVGFVLNSKSGSLSIDVSECGISSSKRTMVTLDAEEVDALRKLLNRETP